MLHLLVLLGLLEMVEVGPRHLAPGQALGGVVAAVPASAPPAPLPDFPLFAFFSLRLRLRLGGFIDRRRFLGGFSLGGIDEVGDGEGSGAGDVGLNTLLRDSSAVLEII